MPATASSAFISYSREDSEFALRLAQDLKAAGANVWLDQTDITPGHPWDNAIEDALTNAPEMLVILSPASAKSQNVRDEIDFALRGGKIVIPILYIECVVPLRLGRTQRIDFRADYARGLAHLLDHLRVTNPDPAILQKAAEGDAQRQAAWQAREAEAQRLRDLADQQRDEADRQTREEARLKQEAEALAAKELRNQQESEAIEAEVNRRVQARLRETQEHVQAQQHALLKEREAEAPHVIEERRNEEQRKTQTAEVEAEQAAEVETLQTAGVSAAQETEIKAKSGTVPKPSVVRLIPLQVIPEQRTDARKFPIWAWGALAAVVLVAVFAAIRLIAPKPIPSSPATQSQPASNPAASAQPTSNSAALPARADRPPSTLVNAGKNEAAHGEMAHGDAAHGTGSPAAGQVPVSSPPNVMSTKIQQSASSSKLQDQDLVKEAYERSCANGFADSCAKLRGSTEPAPSPTPQGQDFVKEAYERACANGFTDSCAKLRELYGENKSTP